LSLGQLLIQRLRRVVLEGQSRFADSDGGGFLAHLLTLQVSLQGVEEEAVMGDAVPIEDLLLLLRSDTVVLVEEVEESALGLFQRGIGSRLEIAQVREDTFLKLLGVLDGSTKGLESERQATNNVGAGDVEEVVPKNARHIFASWQEKAADVLVWLPIDGGRDEKVFQIINLLKGNLCIMGQSLLSLGAQHESLRLLGSHVWVL
jgi:hypothetical protein